MLKYIVDKFKFITSIFRKDTDNQDDVHKQPIKPKRSIKQAKKQKPIFEGSMSFVEIKCKKKRSKGEQIVKDYLDKKGILYEEEYTFSDCVYKRQLRFDFYLIELDACIEFDGKQHFEAVSIYGGDEALKSTQVRDKIKTDYCKKKGIPLLRIMYNEKNVNAVLDDFIQTIH